MHSGLQLPHVLTRAVVNSHEYTGFDSDEAACIAECATSRPDAISSFSVGMKSSLLNTISCIH